ncbi:universal stress protein [Aneurinibacillus sp. Ricciae_BoGa-3]|uniref:universal stress protein n=1 Tax=Aneurinibacillus sp. Ricciae_BoGa-3 TaxID=3022697 RepID=UPI0023419B8F|nr:universal stress protein [Aneurinibacillus sp. Ricciae_BoGa-3]WCK52644.1 universal stress protein [Aneurinibacillus sp. Ricciae_BoGa-3]
MLYSKILVPYEDSELANQSLKAAISIAKTDPSVEIDVLHVANLPIADAYSLSNTYGQIRESILEYGQEVISKAKNELAKIPNKSSASVIEGLPADVILDYAKNHECELIIMGSRGLTGLKEVFLGSVSHSVVQRSSIPVLIMK